MSIQKLGRAFSLTTALALPLVLTGCEPEAAKTAPTAVTENHEDDWMKKWNELRQIVIQEDRVITLTSPALTALGSMMDAGYRKFDNKSPTILELIDQKTFDQGALDALLYYAVHNDTLSMESPYTLYLIDKGANVTASPTLIVVLAARTPEEHHDPSLSTQETRMLRTLLDNGANIDESIAWGEKIGTHEDLTEEEQTRWRGAARFLKEVKEYRENRQPKPIQYPVPTPPECR